MGARWRQTVSLVIGSTLIALLFGWAWFGFRSAGARSLPAIEVRLGAARLVGLTTTIHLCPRLLHPDCFFLRPPPRAYVYTLWLFIEAEPRSGRAPEVRQMLSIPLGHQGPAP
ncbi:MAG TPA: hypothetical protein VNL77_20860 [Roseiflexaceae bacterium]|nr:hypothetical protein [Roseiflexaceae bacterium]